MPRARIAPCLWFDGRVEEAAKLYCSVFPRSRIVRTAYYPDVGKEIHGHDAGEILTIDLELDGEPLTLLHGGSNFQFSEAVSLQVMCEDQTEIDHYWSKLSEGGDPKAQQCGWLKDRFGVSWQVTTQRLAEMSADPDAARVGRMMKAMFPMKKLDLAKLEAAFAGR
jgi:predicted 3-demethylubiquinone-9 3-methyltransferase (glyoxalase superfamily)